MEPGDRAPRIENGLPAHLCRAADVGTDDVVGAEEGCRTALVVIREGEPQCTEAEAVQQAA